jgi:hypothetical protein
VLYVFKTGENVGRRSNYESSHKDFIDLKSKGWIVIKQQQHAGIHKYKHSDYLQ